MRKLITSLFVLTLLLSSSLMAQNDAPPTDKVASPPNIVFILADDLGYGEVGVFGQKKIKTPNLDKLAREGMMLTQHYCGAPVCAPSRCVLLTGKKLSRAAIRGNKEVKPEGQWPVGSGELTIAEVLKMKGYRTGAMGKWGLGPPGSESAPNAKGFDFFYGYNCQRQAHNFFPTHLWLNGEKHILNNAEFPAHQKAKDRPLEELTLRGNEYAPHLIANAGLAFLRREHKKPFFLYLPFVEPHLAMQPPEKWVDMYPKSWDEKPYLGQRSYLPHPRPRAGYAAMITHLDDHVGRVVALIDELGLAENTLIIFSSDNGPTHNVGGVDTEFFDSSGGLRGRKGSVFEGGLRVPTIARWTGKIKPGSKSNVISAFEDWFPTFVDVAETQGPKRMDGVSLLPSLLGKEGQEVREYLSWEFAGYGGQQAVRKGKWKAVRRRLHKGQTKILLFDLEHDPAESKDLAAEYPEIVQEMDKIMRTDRTVNATFPVKMLDGKK